MSSSLYTQINMKTTLSNSCYMKYWLFINLVNLAMVLLDFGSGDIYDTNLENDGRLDTYTIFP